MYCKSNCLHYNNNYNLHVTRITKFYNNYCTYNNNIKIISKIINNIKMLIKLSYL